jgi:PAS domain S-box-containing protein
MMDAGGQSIPKMPDPDEAQDAAGLLLRLRQVREELREARETIEAIRSGDVDAIVVQGGGAPQIYTLENDDRPYRRLIEQIGEGALTLTPDGIIVYCNNRMAELLGMPQEKVIGGQLLPMLAADEQGEFEHLLARGWGRRELTLQTAAGGAVPVYLSLTELINDGARTLCGILTDLTEQKQAETALGEAHARLVAEITEREHTEALLHQARKLEAVGQLTGGVAHDFNNLLTLVIGGLEIIERQLPGLPPGAPTAGIQRGMTMATKGANRATTLIQQLLAFSRRHPLDPRPVDVNTVVSGILDLLHRTLGEAVTLDADLTDGVWLALVDPNQLESAVINLAVNARDAMPAGGRLTVRTDNRRRPDPDTTDPALCDYVMIAVTDSGAGMSQETLDRAFEPFFTTKDVGSGTGLGLSQVYGFAKQSGGYVTLRSRSGSGTTIEIYLPRLVHAPDRDGAVVEEIHGAPGPVQGETILVVEDNDDVRSYSVGALRELGYDVMEAADGWSALEVLDRQAGIRLLFSDIGLPRGMDGWALAHQAVGRRTSLKVLLTTGYAQRGGDTAQSSDDGVHLLAKPFTFSDLAASIRRVLDGQPLPPPR